MLISTSRDSKPKFRLSGVALSCVGCELLRIVDQKPMPEYTEVLKKYFAEQNYKWLRFPILAQ